MISSSGLSSIFKRLQSFYRKQTIWCPRPVKTEEPLEAIDELKTQAKQARKTLLATLADTKARAEEILSDARVSADELTAQAMDNMNVAKKTYATLLNDISSSGRNLDKIKAEYAQVTKQLAKVREVIRAFVGAG